MKNTTRISVVLAISLIFFSAEIAVGFKTKSLALIADAFHYFNDIVAYGIAFVAAYLQDRGQHTSSFTFAFHRAELVGAFFNGVFLLALGLSIFLQSIERFLHVQEVDDTELVLIIGCIGLALNIISVIVVHDHHGHGHAPESLNLNALNVQKDHIHETHNHRVAPPLNKPKHNVGLVGVLIHLLGDAVNNIGVIIAAVILMKLDSPKRFYVDPSISLAICFMVFGSAIPMTLRSGRILLEASPIYLDLAKVKEDILSIPDVLSVHDLHVWHLSQSVILGSLHVCVPIGTSLEQWEKTERYLQICFEEYGISHVTISPEIFRTSENSAPSTEDKNYGCKAQDDFGCAVSVLKKRRFDGSLESHRA